MGMENVIKVKNWLFHCERIFADLGMDDEQKRKWPLGNCKEHRFIGGIELLPKFRRKS